jgi:hypothetical protein
MLALALIVIYVAAFFQDVAAANFILVVRELKVGLACIRMTLTKILSFEFAKGRRRRSSDMFSPRNTIW